MAWHLMQMAALLAQGAKPAAAELPWYREGWFLGLVALAVVVLPFVVGAMLARSLRMPDYATKIGLLLFAVTAGVVICALGWPPKLGIDLSGGVILVYEVDQSKQSGNLADAVQLVREKLNKAGLQAAEITETADNRLQVTVPGEDPDLAKRIERAVTDVKLPNLDFRLSESKTDRVLFSIERPQQDKVLLDNLVTAISRRVNPGGVKEVTIRPYGHQQIEIIIPKVDEAEVELLKKKVSTAGLLVFRITADERLDRDIVERAQRTKGKDVSDGEQIVARWVKLDPRLTAGGYVTCVTKDDELEVLVLIDGLNVTGSYLVRAAPTIDQSGNPAVNFSFNQAGAMRFGKLTGNNLPTAGYHRNLGIVLDDVLLSAPRINSTITDHGIIEGGFTKPEVDFLVEVLNAGSLPAALNPKPISENVVSPQLGEDTIRSGALAMAVSVGAVLLFMLVYYRFAGVVANLAVILNITLVVAIMIMLKAAFTLAGLAGLVLSVGMAVDANVLLYERMREELARGAALRMAIRNGFSRAMSTIVDSNLTTLFVAIVLYAIGTDQLKGFAVTLILGLTLNLFTAVYCARVVFDIAERRRWITKLNMMQIVGETNFDVVRLMRPAVILSLLVIGIGAAAVVARGTGLFGIDFTGGSSVQFVFQDRQGAEIAEVREKLSALPDVAVSSVGTTEEQRDLQYKIDTSEGDLKVVKDTLLSAFPGRLLTYSMQYGTLTRIEAEAAVKPPAETPAATEEAKPADESAKAPPEEAAAKESPEAKESEETKEPAKEDGARFTAEDYQLLAQADDAAKAPADEKPATQSPTANEKAATETSAATPPESTPMIGGTRVKLTFPQQINADSLSDMIQSTLQTESFSDVLFELESPDGTSSGTRPFGEWELSTSLPPDDAKRVLDRVQSTLNATPVFLSASEIGAKVAGNTKQSAIVALVASWVIIVIYVWIRFQNVLFGVAAVIALIHDVSVTVGIIALSYWLAPFLGFLMVDPFKISLDVVAALLTIVGFSINDTIVIFDRIREVRGKSPELTGEMINKAVNQTMGRTILTTATVLIVSIILFAVGGEGIHAFAFAMVVGLISGTYSTVFIAAPFVLWLKRSPQKATARATEPALRTSA